MAQPSLEPCPQGDDVLAVIAGLAALDWIRAGKRWLASITAGNDDAGGIWVLAMELLVAHGCDPGKNKNGTLNVAVPNSAHERC